MFVFTDDQVPAVNSIELARASRELVCEIIDTLSKTPADQLDLSENKAPYTTSVYAIKNSRKTMEDRHVVIHDLNATLQLGVSTLDLSTGLFK